MADDLPPGLGLEEQRVFASVARAMLGEQAPLPKLGRFEVRERIGSGGMGQVYGAFDPDHQREVAIKVLLAHREADPTASHRLEREARALARLEHENVVAVYEVGEADDRLFIVMERLYGESLAGLLAREGPLPPARALSILADICRAIDKAHALSIVHRDLKPANVFLLADGRAKVLDFGIAKGLSMGTLDASTASGTVMGTLSYMSPEQARDSTKVDGRADLWAIAVIAYQCILGKLPFDAGNLAALVVQIVVNAPPVPSQHGEVPSGFDAWFARATSRAPDDRFATASELAAQLQVALGSQPQRAPRRWALAVGVAVLALAAVLLFFASRSSTSPAPRQREAPVPPAVVQPKVAAPDPPRDTPAATAPTPAAQPELPTPRPAKQRRLEPAPAKATDDAFEF